MNVLVWRFCGSNGDINSQQTSFSSMVVGVFTVVVAIAAVAFCWRLERWGRDRRDGRDSWILASWARQSRVGSVQDWGLPWFSLADYFVMYLYYYCCWFLDDATVLGHSWLPEQLESLAHLHYKTYVLWLVSFCQCQLCGEVWIPWCQCRGYQKFFSTATWFLREFGGELTGSNWSQIEKISTPLFFENLKILAPL